MGSKPEGEIWAEVVVALLRRPDVMVVPDYVVAIADRVMEEYRERYDANGGRRYKKPTP